MLEDFFSLLDILTKIPETHNYHRQTGKLNVALVLANNIIKEYLILPT